MSNLLTRAVRGLAVPLPSQRRFVLFIYADHASDREGLAWPSIATVGRECGLNEQTVRTEVGRLCTDGWLLLRAYRTGGRGRATVYRVMPSVPLPGDPENPPVPPEGIAADKTLRPDRSLFSIPYGGRPQYPTVAPEGKPQKHEAPARTRMRARARGGRFASPPMSRAAGPPTPLTTQLVIESIASNDPGLADVLRRVTTPPAGGAPAPTPSPAPDSPESNRR